MESRKKQILLLAFLIILLFTINYSYLDNTLKNFLDQGEFVNVTRVIDGDTIVIGENTSVRLLGINSPERGEEYYEEAKEFLEKEVLGKEVKLEFGKDKFDRYNRVLAYIQFNSKNINLEIVKNGLANYYFPSGKDIYYNEFKEALQNCIDKGINICGKSIDECSSCIELKEFDSKNEIIIFHNLCDFDCDLTGWEIKDEGRKKFVFGNFMLKKNKEVKIKVGEGNATDDTLFWEGEDYVWTKTGDTLFLKDKNEKLVLWESY